MPELRSTATAVLVLALCAASAPGGGKGSDIGGPPPEEKFHRPEFGTAPSEMTDAEKESRFKTLQKEYEDLKRNQDVMPTRQRRKDIRFIGEMRYPPAAKWLETVFDGDRDNRAQVSAMVAIGQTGDVAVIQSVVKKALANAKREPVFVLSLPRMFESVTNPEAGKWLAEKLEPRDPEQLAALIEAVGLTGVKEAVPALFNLIDKGKDPAVKFEALRAYGRCGREDAVPKLYAALSDADWRLRMAAAEGLRFAGDPRAISEIVKLITAAEEPITVETAVEAVGELGLAKEGTKESIPPLLDALHVGRLRCREKARQYLIKLAKKLYRQDRDYSIDEEAWRRWFEKVKRGFDPDDPNYKKRETSAFFRFAISSDRVLFILDVSGSMEWPGAPKGLREREWKGRRIDLAHTELFRSIRSLHKDTLFNVATFSGAVMAWQKEEVPATKENLEAAVAWLQLQLPRGGTSTFDAIDYGLQKTKADTIYFLSDGVPSTGRYEEPETILAELRKSNRYRRVSVNTVAFIIGKADYEKALKYEDPDEMAEFMSRIAEENFGQFEDRSSP